MIMILLFNLLLRSLSSFRGVRRTAVQMPFGMLRGAGGGFLDFRSSDAVSRVQVELACNGPLDAV